MTTLEHLGELALNKRRLSGLETPDLNDPVTVRLALGALPRPLMLLAAQQFLDEPAGAVELTAFAAGCTELAALLAPDRLAAHDDLDAHALALDEDEEALPFATSVLHLFATLNAVWDVAEAGGTDWKQNAAAHLVSAAAAAWRTALTVQGEGLDDVHEILGQLREQEPRLNVPEVGERAPLEFIFSQVPPLEWAGAV